jgi:hypothetical protein
MRPSGVGLDCIVQNGGLVGGGFSLSNLSIVIELWMLNSNTTQLAKAQHPGFPFPLNQDSTARRHFAASPLLGPMQ